MAGVIGEPPPKYTDEQRKRAVEIAQEEGIGAAARAIGCDKASVSQWLRKAGLEPADVSKRHSERNKTAAAASVASRQAKVAEFEEQMADALMGIARLAAAKEIELLRGQRVIGAETQDVRLSEVVGSRTRAIHDLLRLTQKDGQTSGLRPDARQVANWRDELAERRAKVEIEAQRAVGE